MMFSHPRHHMIPPEQEDPGVAEGNNKKKETVEDQHQDAVNVNELKLN